VVLGALILAVVLGVGSLAAGYLQSRLEHDWTSVASVNGHAISREALRGRMAVLSFLAGERATFLGEAATAAQLSKTEATTLEGEAAKATTIDAARDSLIDDELLRQLAPRDGVATPASPDPWAEATTYVTSDLARRVRVVGFGLPATASTNPPVATSSGNGWPPAAAANLDAATARVRTELTVGTKIETIVAGLHDAGWVVNGQDVAVSGDGAPADPSLQLDPTIAAGAIVGKPGQIVGPATDLYGRVNIGLILEPRDPTPVAHRLPFEADKAKLDTSALQSWADGQALRRAVTASLLEHWRTAGVNQAHFRELVIGPAPDTSGTPGPWVELSALPLDALKSVNPTSIAGAPAGLNLDGEALAKTLKAMSVGDRSSLFGKLVAAAKAAPPAGSSDGSGELGFYGKGDLTPDLGKAAFDSPVKTGDVLGPISTSAGPQLFLVESRYSGSLDDRSRAALRQVGADLSPDLLAYTRQFAPTDVALATDAGWRAEPEFGSSEPVHAALFDTPLNTLSDPFILDGKLARAIVSERRTAVPDARTLDRLALDGYDAWFGSELAKATITRSENPLPELMPSSSPSATATVAAPTMPPFDTPIVPVIPGQAAPSPVATDAFGLPALP
jgi:hypothetical protein